MLEPLPGTPEAKARLAAIIASISGEKFIPELCRELGIGEARFHALRKEFLTGAMGLLERQTSGRKASSGDVPPELTRLRDENERLHLELEAAQIRAELAAVMPRALKPLAAAEGSKKKRRKRG
jgi:Ser/Thr protein kinase RdoA (MazF antagonist)